MHAPGGRRAPADDHIGEITTEAVYGPVNGPAVAVDELQPVVQGDGRKDPLDRRRTADQKEPTAQIFDVLLCHKDRAQPAGVHEAKPLQVNRDRAVGRSERRGGPEKRGRGNVELPLKENAVLVAVMANVNREATHDARGPPPTDRPRQHGLGIACEKSLGKASGLPTEQKKNRLRQSVPARSASG